MKRENNVQIEIHSYTNENIIDSMVLLQLNFPLPNWLNTRWSTVHDVDAMELGIGIENFANFRRIVKNEEKKYAWSWIRS